MKKEERRVLRLLTAVGLLLTVLFAGWWFQPSHVPANFHGWLHAVDYGLFAIVSYVIWHQITMELLTWSISRKMHRHPSPEPTPGKKVAFITTYVPGAETPELLHKILPALVAADYPHDSWLLDEGDDAEAKAICKLYGVKYFSRKNMPEYNTPDGTFAARTKGGNHNAWYDAVGLEYDYVAQIDTDFIPDRSFLRRTLGYFRDPNVAFVGTPQVYGNIESYIARGAGQQQYNFYGPVLRGLFGSKMCMMLGANHVVRVAALKEIGLYAGHLTEDLLTGMTLHARGYYSVYVPDQLAVGLGPVTWQAYFNQQLRWAQGCFDILFRHSFKHFRQMDNARRVRYYFLQQHYFSGLAAVLGLVLLSLYFVFGWTPAAVMLLPMLALYLPLLLWQYAIHRWLQKFYVNPEAEKGFNLMSMVMSIAAWPIYFMALIGAVRGKRLVFKVTPKGEDFPKRESLRLFWPHFMMGSVAATDLWVAPTTHHESGVMVFWVALIALTMFGFALHQWAQAFWAGTKRLLLTQVSLPRFARVSASE